VGGPSPAGSATASDPADDVTTAGAETVDLGRGQLDPMGVVLRLPPGRVRGGTRTVEHTKPAVGPDDPAVGPDDREAPEAGTRGSGGGVGGWLGAGSDASDGGLEFVDLDVDVADRTDWAWVQEWRAGNEPTPWATGLVLTVFAALVVGVAVWVLAAGLSDRPVIAILVNLLVAGGLAPAIWLSRGLPVLRWLGAGAAAGIVIGWISAVLMLPLPTP
jgi:hypothetical protein